MKTLTHFVSIGDKQATQPRLCEFTSTLGVEIYIEMPKKLCVQSWNIISIGYIHSKRNQGSCWQCLKLHLHYFGKSPLIIFNELFIHNLYLCFGVHEIGLLWIWSHFTMLLKSFVIHKALVDKVLLRTLKFECVFCYSNLHQMFSNLSWVIIYFIRRATCLYF